METLLKKSELQKLMTKFGYDNYSLAKKMGVAPSTIYRVLNGDRGVGGNLIPKLLTAFDLTESDFDKLFIFKNELPYSNNKQEVS